MFRLFLILGLALVSTAFAAPCPTRVIFAPPYVKDIQLSDWLTNIAERQLTESKFFPCFVNVNREEESDFFDLFAMDSYTLKNFYTQAQIRYLRDEIKATHIVFVSSKGYQIFQLGKDSLKLMNKQSFNLTPSDKQEHSSVFWKRKLIQISANVLSLGSSTSSASIRIKDKAIEPKISDTTNYTFLSALSLYRIDHPSAFDNLDFSGSFFPMLTYLSMEQDFSESEEFTETRHHMQMRSLCPGALGQLSLYWPLGTTYFGYGFSLCGMQVIGESREAEYKGLLSSQFQMGHRIFITRRFFVSLQYDFYNFNRNFYNTDIASAKLLYRGILEIGWFFPTPKSLLRSL